MSRTLFSLLFMLISTLTAVAEMGVPIQLKLKSPSGTYPTEAGLSFKLLILSPATNCILREENFSAQSINNGSISLVLGNGARGVNDPTLSLNQVYDNSKPKTGLSCVDVNNNVVSVGQIYNPVAGDQRTIRVTSTISGDPILVNFTMRATPFAIQAESVGGKPASDIIVNDAASQMNQTNLNDLLQDVGRFNNLKNLAVSGNVNSAVNFSGSLAGDVSGTQGATSVDRIKGVPVSATAPSNNQVLQYDGAQYIPATLPAAPVTSVAGRTGAIILSSSDISGLGNSASRNVGTAAGTVAAGDDSRITGALQSSSVFSGDVSGISSAISVNRVGAKTSAEVATSVNDTQAATSANTVSTIVKRDASGNISTSSVSATNTSTQNVYVYDASNTNSIRIKAPVAAFSNYVLTLPLDAGTNGQVLQTDGSGNLTWINPSTGSVTSVTAGAPLSSSGGTTPNITIAQANSSASGYLSSADWTSFNNKQAALGFVPLNAASNLSDLANAATARTNLGLGGAALLNVGTAVGTVAAGDDARINGALQSAAFNAYVASASCTTSQTMYWNSVSSQFECQAINFPADAVTSVAGRTGAVVLSSSDISGLSFGTAANTFAQGNDSRITGALQSSSIFSGDISGTVSSINVNKIRGVVVSNTAPTVNQVLQYDGSQYVPVSLPSAPVSSVAGRTGAVILSSSDISGLGNSASRNVGTSAGTVAAGDDSRITGALQSSSVFSGDVSGTISSINVNKLRGVAISATAPTVNQVLQYDGSQYVPVAIPSAPVSSVAGRTGAVVLSNSDISGLSFGTAANTFAEGNDSRITGALQASAFNASVAPAACTSSQSMYWNSVSSEFQCQAISFPADAVSSVAGRTGAVVLSSSDISGLSFGTVANTFAQGNDSRIVNAFQVSSTALSGDISGTSTTVSVNRIRGIAVSAAAPTVNQVLQYDGSQYVPAALPSAPVTTVAGRTGAVVLSSSDISGLSFGTVANTFAQGNDSRIVNAVQTSTVHSGDVSGTASTISVNRIRGIAVSATSPTVNQVLQYDGSQYVPAALPSAPVSSVAGRTGAVVLASSDISGLSFGTAANTFAQGNDSRISGALQSSAFDAYVASASCTASESMYWNSVSSQFLCQAINFPADAVTSVAGRTGAVVLSSADVSGLGNVVSRNIGTTAGTAAAGDDSRIVNAFQISSTALSGDISGTSTTVSVDKIKGRNISSTAPTTGQALVWDGTQWVPTTGFPKFIKKTADQTFTVTAVANVTLLAIPVVAGVSYKFKFNVLYTSAATGTGLRIGITYPAATISSALANIPGSTVDGTGFLFSGFINNSGDSVMAANTPAALPTVIMANIEGVFVAAASGTIQLQAATEIAGSAIVIKAGSFAEVTEMP